MTHVDFLPGSSRPAGTETRTPFSSAGGGATQQLPAQGLAGASAATLGPGSSLGACQGVEAPLSPLSSKSLQQPIPRRGSQRQKVHAPIAGDTETLCPEAQGLRWGSVEVISDLNSDSGTLSLHHWGHLPIPRSF